MRKVKPESYQYIESLSADENPLKQKARASALSLGLEGISLSKPEAQILQFFLQTTEIKMVVEVGTLTGLSALYILETLPHGGCLWSLEKSPEHINLAEEVLQSYIADQTCKILAGDAVENLKDLKKQGPFDAVFIDGNKAAYLEYFNWAVENVRSGGLIAVDNVFLSGAVWGAQTQQKFGEKQIAAVKNMNRAAFDHKKLISVIVPTDEGMLLCKKQ